MTPRTTIAVTALGLCRCDQVNVALVGWAVIQHEGHPYQKGKPGHRQVQRAGDVKTQRRRPSTGQGEAWTVPFPPGPPKALSPPTP